MWLFLFISLFTLEFLSGFDQRIYYHFRSAGYIKDIIYGGQDGIVSTFVARMYLFLLLICTQSGFFSNIKLRKLWQLWVESKVFTQYC